jgi:hypothetical protein
MSDRTNLLPGELVKGLSRQIGLTPREKLPEPDFAWSVVRTAEELCGRPFDVKEWTGLVNQLVSYRGLCEVEPCNWKWIASETPSHYPSLCAKREKCPDCDLWEGSSAASRRAQMIVAAVHLRTPEKSLGEGELPGFLLKRFDGQVAVAFIERVVDFWTLFKPDVEELEGLPKEVRCQFDEAVEEVANALDQHAPPKDGAAREALKEALLTREHRTVPERVQFRLQVLEFFSEWEEDGVMEVVNPLSKKQLAQCEFLLETPVGRSCIAQKLQPNGCAIPALLLDSAHCNFFLKGNLGGRSWADLIFTLAKIAREEDGELLEAMARWRGMELVGVSGAAEAAAQLRETPWGVEIAKVIEPEEVSVEELRANRGRALQLVHLADPANLDGMRDFLWSQFDRSKNREVRRAFVELALRHADRRWAVPTRITPTLVDLIPLGQMETALQHWGDVRGLRAAIAAQLANHLSDVGPLGASALWDHCVQAKKWEHAVQLLESKPELLDGVDWGRCFPRSIRIPSLETLEKLVVLYQGREEAKGAAAALSTTLVKHHLNRVKGRVSLLCDLILLPCRFGGGEELVAAHKMLLELQQRKQVDTATSAAIQLVLFSPMADVISATPLESECDEAGVVQIASDHTWGDSAPPLVKDGLDLFDSVLTMRLHNRAGHGEALEQLCTVARRSPSFTHLPWAIEEMVGVVRARHIDAALTLRTLVRLAVRHAGWDADKVVEVALDLVKRQADTQQLQTLLVPQAFRASNGYNRAMMASVYYGFAEEIVDQELPNDHLLLALGQLRFLQGMGVREFDRERLEQLLGRRDWASAAYDDADKMFKGEFPKDATPSEQGRVIVEVAMRSASDAHDEEYGGLDYKNVKELAKTAQLRMRRAHYYRGELPEAFSWIGEENDRLWQGTLARVGDGDALEALRSALEAQLQQDCGLLTKLQWRAHVHRLVSCCSYYAGLPQDQQRELLFPLLEGVAKAGLFEGKRHLLTLLLEEIIGKHVETFGEHEGRRFGMEMLRQVQPLLGDQRGRFAIVRAPSGDAN